MSDRRGSSLVLVAVMFSFGVVLLAGWLQLTGVMSLRSEVQRAADAAALAGAAAWRDGSSTDSARVAIGEIASLNTVNRRPVALELVELTPDSIVVVVAGYQSGPLLVLPRGIHLRALAAAKVLDSIPKLIR